MNIEDLKLFEDEYMLVIDKPAGVLVHGDKPRLQRGTIAFMLCKQYPEVKRIGEPGRQGIVHRLDLETSGVLVLAKTLRAYEGLRRQFKQHLIEKEYVALAAGEIKDKKLTVDLPIIRSDKDPRKRLALPLNKALQLSNNPRAAETEFEVERVIETAREDLRGIGLEKFTFLKARPKTGRTHQIRVHLKAINHPLAGDMLYTPPKQMKVMRRAFPRHFLHASRLSLDHPVVSGPITFAAEMPADLEKVLAGL